MRNLYALVALCVGLCSSAPAIGQEGVRPETHPDGILFVVTDKSGRVTNESPLFLASNAVGWNAGDPGMRLAGRSDLRWQILLPGPVASGNDAWLEFKFTRGAWETVEVSADLGDISNRVLERVDPTELEAGKPYVVELTVEAFADQREGAPQPQFRDDPTRPLDVTGDAFRMQVVGGAGAASGALRDVVVWLPPGYHDPANADRRYPVLYMQDGQNVFDYQPPTPGEWRADETAAAQIRGREIEPVIIVGVPHSGANRTVEYLPAYGGEALGVDGAGDAYLAWLVREVIPRVERAVRASEDPDDRGIGGSSLGGLLVLRAAQLYPEHFGRFLCESPALVLNGATVAKEAGEGIDLDGERLFLAMGGNEYGPDQAQRNRLLLRSATLCLREMTGGVDFDDMEHLDYVLEPDAQHNEAAWASRLDRALRHLYPGY